MLHQVQFRSLNATLRLIAAMLLSVAATAAAAQTPAIPKPDPSAEKGAELAAKLCSNCHLMEGHTTSVPAGVISMRGIANRQGQTGQRVHDMLIQPHPPMPDIRLSVEEIQSVIFYLETLRTNQATPPLIQEDKTMKKPIYPQPG